MPVNPKDEVGFIKLQAHQDFLDQLAKDPKVIDLRELGKEENG